MLFMQLNHRGENRAIFPYDESLRVYLRNRVIHQFVVKQNCADVRFLALACAVVKFNIFLGLHTLNFVAS